MIHSCNIKLEISENGSSVCMEKWSSVRSSCLTYILIFDIIMEHGKMEYFFQRQICSHLFVFAVPPTILPTTGCVINNVYGNRL